MRKEPKRAVASAMWSAALAAGTPVLGGLAGCAPTPLHVASLDAADRARATVAALEAARDAPEAYAGAERERDLAHRAHAARDDVSANLHAEHALAAYRRAVVAARLLRASSELSEAQKTLQEVTARLGSIDAERAKIDREADDLDRRAQVVRDRLLPAPSAAANAEREAARWTAARSLVAEARLLCGAARLVDQNADGLAAAANDVSSLAARFDRPMPKSAAVPLSSGPSTALSRHSPIDDAAAARVRCLDVLTRARQSKEDGAVPSDGLLSELSASGGWDPIRNERGVVVTLRNVYRGGELAADSAERLAELGRVAAAHPSFAIQLVLHDSSPPARGEPDDLDQRRAAAAARALVASGAAPSRVHAEFAGALLPIADPSDPRQRPRNERLEVVFVGP